MNRMISRHKLLTITAILLVLLLAGCGKTNNVEQPKPEIGVLNMTKAIKAHPRYAEIEKLQAERATLRAQLSQQQSESVAARKQAELDLGNLAKATDQEFQAQMASKHAALNRELQTLSETLRRQLAEQVDQYVKELDAGYLHRNFELQVKLKTVDLKQEEQAAVQEQIDALQNERMEKIAAKQQELTAGMTEKLQQAEQAAAKELDAYGADLQRKLSAELDKKAQAMRTSPSGALNMPAAGTPQTKLEANQQELAKLQQAIVADIRQHAAAIAVKQGLHTVIADVEIFTSAASDITSAVIDASK